MMNDFSVIQSIQNHSKNLNLLQKFERVNYKLYNNVVSYSKNYNIFLDKNVEYVNFQCKNVPQWLFLQVFIILGLFMGHQTMVEKIRLYVLLQYRIGVGDLKDKRLSITIPNCINCFQACWELVFFFILTSILNIVIMTCVNEIEPGTLIRFDWIKSIK